MTRTKPQIHSLALFTAMAASILAPCLAMTDDDSPDVDTLQHFQSLSDRNVRTMSSHQLMAHWPFVLPVAEIDEETLFLNSIRSLTPAQAAELSRYTGTTISLPDLERIDCAVATQLIRWQGSTLYLNGLKELDPSVADILSRWQGLSLSFASLQQIDEATSRELARWSGSRNVGASALRLDGLAELEEEVASHLVSWNGRLLSFNGLQHLPPSLAHQLARASVSDLSLNGLTEIDVATARELGNWKSRPMIPDTHTFRGGLRLNGLSLITPEIAQELVRFKGDKLFLNGLETICSETARKLASWEGVVLSLSGLTTIDDDVVDALLSWNDTPSLLSKELLLDGLPMANDIVIRLVEEWSGRNLALRGLKDIPPDAEAIFRDSINKLSLSEEVRNALLDIRE